MAWTKIRLPRLVAASLALSALTLLPAVNAMAAQAPAAEISINPAPGSLTVHFVAASAGFSSKVVAYTWAFGDGHSAKTSVPTVSHTYGSASTFTASLTETAANGATAAASGRLKLTRCPAGGSVCTESLGPVQTITQLQVTGPEKAPTAGAVNLFDGPFQIASCEPQISPAPAFSDSGFSGPLTVTVSYTTSHPNQTGQTCFSSTVPFKDAGGKIVTSGALPSCHVKGAQPPCVQSVTTGVQVKKVLLVPPGDPTVGAP
jgi:PKD repeat protein